MSRRPRLALTLGDPCGIGPELLLGSLAALQAVADLTVVGCRGGIDLLKGLAGAPVTWRWYEDPDPAPRPGAAWLGRLETLSLNGATPEVLGTAAWLDPTPELRAEHLCLGVGSAASGKATVEAIRLAARLALSGEVDALVTLPMAKSAAHLAGFPIPGHTEFLRDLAGVPRVQMAFVSPSLNVVLHTVHQSLRSVLDTLEAGEVAETLTFATEHFQRLWGRPGLRVALCALNPHAGEQGAFGGEEALLTEALDRARAQVLQGLLDVDGPKFTGPLPADSVFVRAALGEFDLVVALYHDQGLIPVKLMEPTRAVNLTLGLPYIRTSPDHGTAFDKAGKWIGDARNFMEAAALAVRLAEGRGLASGHGAPGP